MKTAKKIKKTYYLEQDLINKVKKISNAQTETEAVTIALEEYIFKKRLIEWNKRHAGKFQIINHYE